MEISAITRSRPPAIHLRMSHGFTLIELMITVSIAAILLAIGVPSFRYITSANRASAEINGLLGDLQFARAEAIKEGQTVTVCPTVDGNVCAVTASWQTGWLIFPDPANSGLIANNELLKQQKAFSGQDTLQPDNGTLKNVMFNRDGFAMNLANPATFILHDSTANHQFTRCLSLTIIGALSTQIGGGLTAEGNSCQ